MIAEENLLIKFVVKCAKSIEKDILGNYDAKSESKRRFCRQEIGTHGIVQTFHIGEAYFKCQSYFLNLRTNWPYNIDYNTGEFQDIKKEAHEHHKWPK